MQLLRLLDILALPSVPTREPYSETSTSGRSAWRGLGAVRGVPHAPVAQSAAAGAAEAAVVAEADALFVAVAVALALGLLVHEAGWQLPLTITRSLHRLPTRKIGSNPACAKRMF